MRAPSICCGSSRARRRAPSRSRSSRRSTPPSGGGGGGAAGAVAFAIVAKIDADKWREWAWPLMLITIVTMALTLVLPDSIAPRINGSKRFLFGSSFQPSGLGKLGVIVWVSMLVVRKGDTLRRLTKGLVPFLVVIGLLDVLAALEPDLSVSMLYTLLMALL